MFAKIRSLFRWCAGVLLCTAFIVLFVNNRERMTIDVFPLPYIVEFPKYLYALFFVGLGLLLGWLITARSYWRVKGINKQMTQKIAALENELAGLKVEQIVSLPSSASSTKP